MKTKNTVNEEQERDLKQAFTYHPGGLFELEAYDAINKASMHLAYVILEYCPPSPDRTDALRIVRLARMMANASIACHGVILR